MSDNGATAFSTQLAVTCGFCGNANTIPWFCKSCTESLCNTCKDSHPTIPMFKNHTVVPRTNDVMRLYGPSKIAEQCRIHPEKEISTYCKNCQEPCCVTCQVQNHQKHDISTIEDEYLSAEKRLNDRAKELEKNVLPTLGMMSEKTGKERSEKKVHVDRVKEEVNTFRKEMKKAVDESCDGLIEKLEHGDIEYDDVIRSIEAQKGNIDDMIKGINAIIQKGDLSMIKYFPPSPRTLIPEVRTPKLTIPVFTPGMELLTIIRDRIGTIEWTDRNSDPKRTSSSRIKYDPSIININKVGSLRSEIHVKAITTAGKNIAWVMDILSDKMYQYDCGGNIVKSFTVKGSNGVNDMVIRRSGEMIVACGDRKVRRVSLSGEVSTLIDTSPFWNDGICLTDIENVVICMRDQGDRNHVAVFTSDTGEKLREIRGRDGNGKQHITHPYRVVSNDKDMYVVNSYPGDNVVCVDERGEVRWVYEGKEAQLARKFTPRGISADRHNNLLVTDNNNHCVHYIDREGRLIHIILTQEQTGLSYPWGICVDDKTGHVWVGTDSRVVISKYL